MESREDIIRHYIEAYNRFDVAGMLRDLAPTLRFENVSNGQVDLTLTGREAFRTQAEQATHYFTSRTQTITGFQHRGNQTEVAIGYEAVLAIDLPNGLKKGDTLKLHGRSIFTFDGDLIEGITDISG